MAYRILPLTAAGAWRLRRSSQSIQKAKTITWKTTFYQRITSKDGKRTWIKLETRQYAYKSPGLYREVGLDEKRQISWVETQDATRKPQVQLSLIPAKKEATLRELTGSERRSAWTVRMG